MTHLFLHIGLPKTGTTTIQAALDACAADLAAAGVLVPGGGHPAHRLAGFDLVGERVRGEDAAVAGAFERLVEEVRRHPGPQAVVSEEELARARPRQVRRLTGAFAADPLTLVVGVRDLARTITSAWQQGVVLGGTATWAQYAAAVRDPASAEVPSLAASFRLRHDVLRILDVWERHVPRERIRLVTVPPSGASATVLLDRFAAAAELPVALRMTTSSLRRNASPGPAEVEVVRRLNHLLAPHLAPAQQRRVVGRILMGRRAVSGDRSLVLPAQDHDWVRERSAAVVDELAARGYGVHGDLADLEPRLEGGTRAPDEVSDAELLDAAVAALEALGVAHGRLIRRHERANAAGGAGAVPGQGPGPVDLVRSEGRAALFRLQRAALHASDAYPRLAAAVRRLGR